MNPTRSAIDTTPSSGAESLLARRMVEAGVRFVTVNGWTGQAPHDTAGPQQQPGTRTVETWEWEMPSGMAPTAWVASRGSTKHSPVC
ncbi:MAG: hypothetical protein R3C05_08540 [Pirellulaceae bacterium]